MMRFEDRTRRGLTEAIGTPALIGGVTLVLLLLVRLFGTAV